MEVFENKLTEWAKGRRRHFASVDELTEEYLQSRATRGWVAGAHELMARSVLRKIPDGDGYELVCAPENEATIYAQALTLESVAEGARVRRPGQARSAAIPISRARPPTGPANQALGIEGGYDYSFVAGTGHLLQIEKPEECVRLTLEFLGKHGLA